MTKELNSTQRDQLIEYYTEIVVDNMDMQALIQYAQEQLAEYFDTLSDIELKEDINNNWFQLMRDRLTDSGILYVPILDKEFNKSGEEVNTYNSNEGD